MTSAEQIKEIASRQWLPLPGIVSVGLAPGTDGAVRLAVAIEAGAIVDLPSSFMGLEVDITAVGPVRPLDVR